MRGCFSKTVDPLIFIYCSCHFMRVMGDVTHFTGTAVAPSAYRFITLYRKESPSHYLFKWSRSDIREIFLRIIILDDCFRLQPFNKGRGYLVWHRSEEHQPVGG